MLWETACPAYKETTPPGLGLDEDLGEVWGKGETSTLRFRGVKQQSRGIQLKGQQMRSLCGGSEANPMAEAASSAMENPTDTEHRYYPARR